MIPFSVTNAQKWLDFGYFFATINVGLTPRSRIFLNNFYRNNNHQNLGPFSPDNHFYDLLIVFDTKIEIRG
jgi:hypothetical protein